MKYKEIFEEIINEINMSPAGLRSLAADINAQAGMEFEMIVPGANQGDDDYDDDYRETDYDQDESINSIQDAYDFFYDGDFNSRSDVERLRKKMTEDYYDWLSGKLGDKWEEGKEEAIYDWLRYNAAPSEVFGDILGQEPNESGDYPDPTKDDYYNAAAKVIEDRIDPWYEEAEQDFNDNFYQTANMEDEWLEDENINTMQDVEVKYNMTWPHYSTPERETGGVSIEDAADSFARAIGREVQASNNYHSRSITRPSATELHYVVEPDGSLEADEDEDGGLEFVSPALPINELLDDLKKVKAWADKTGCYTNDSTGLHINVSVPNWKGDMAQLDYVKLAVLMGDEYVLNEFGRAGNTYAKSALKMVKDHISQRPDDAKALLDKMREHLNASAAKAIHSGSTNKYTSINTKTGYIEFRSPGGDWLNENFDKIENTLYRFVVALDAAVDESKYKQEYAKKLYKLLTGNENSGTDTLAYFARYAAGDLPQSALKSFIRQAQLERKIKSDTTGGQKYWWSVSRPGYGASAQVVATSKEEAIAIGKAEYPDWANATNMTAKPIKPFENSPKTRYEIYNKQTGNSVEDAEGITNDSEALIRLNDYIEHGPHSLQRGQASAMFGIRRAGGAPVEPIRATVGAPQPAGSVGRDATSPTGQWKIIDGLGRELYRFRPAVNTRAKANELAAAWAQDGQFDGNYQVEPVGHNDTTPRPIQGVTDIQPDITPVSPRQQREYEIFDDATGQVVVAFLAANDSEATQRVEQYRASHPGPFYRIRTAALRGPREGGRFTGIWNLVDGTGRVLYRLSGVGNREEDAYRAAIPWIRNNGHDHTDGLRMVPVLHPE